MRIVVRSVSGERVVELEINHEGATIGDLLEALGEDGPAVLDGKVVGAEAALARIALYEGSLLEVGAINAGAQAAGVETQANGVEPQATGVGKLAAGETLRETERRNGVGGSLDRLAVVGGIRAGYNHELSGSKPALVGRDRKATICVADPTVSGTHCTISTHELIDHRTLNGTTVDGRLATPGHRVELPSGGIIRVGATRLAVRKSLDDRSVAVAQAIGASAGRIAFNRPPRCLPDTAAPTLKAFEEPPEVPPAESISVAGIVLPLIAGAVVALVLNPLFALFAALGPVVSIGTWWEKRRRNRRKHRQQLEEFTTQLATLEEDLPARREYEIARRRALHPDMAEVVRRALGPSVRCWERKAADSDAFRFAIGARDEAYLPAFAGKDGITPAKDITALLEGLPLMTDVPVEVDLSPGKFIGLVGDRAAGLAVARALVLQAVVHHGPCDLALAVGADAPAQWQRCGWLPHATDPSTAQAGATITSTHNLAMADNLLATAGKRTILAVIDGADPFQGRLTVGRRLLGDKRCAAIVLVNNTQRLPAGCDLVVDVDRLGRIRMADPRQGGEWSEALGWGVDEEVAEIVARRLARLDDPELPLVGAGIPAECSLLTLLGVDGDKEAEIRQLWEKGDRGVGLATPIGMDSAGKVVLDLDADGPHVLIGGTTGSGKSELLRCIVAGIASVASPETAAMVLIDYKGGAAFDCCADLPHVVGFVTDLDAQLGARALRSLEAELRYRETRLRKAGAEDWAAFQKMSGARRSKEKALPQLSREEALPRLSKEEALPRLLVVIDEFATLAADLGGFVDALVGIAQRGRSLGVHLILATQRPSGVVTDDIRANATCRIALRVSDKRESTDIIDVGDAANIARSQPGRAIARFGPNETNMFQSALATGITSATAKVVVRSGHQLQDSRAGPTDLARLVATIRRAHGDKPSPRAPWLPPLPDSILRNTIGLPPEEPEAQLLVDVPNDPYNRKLQSVEMCPESWLLVDEPDEQRQTLSGWNPTNGHLVVVGAPKSGLTTTLATAALALLSSSTAPHIYIIDLDAGKLAPLAGLAHCGNYVAPTDRALRLRLLRWLDEEVARRRTSEDQVPPILLVIDDFGGFGRSHDVVREPVVHETLQRIWADGPAVGITVAASTRRSAELPAAMSATAGTIFLHRLVDSSDALRFGIKDSTEAFPNGRMIRVADGLHAQVIRRAPTLAMAVSEMERVQSPREAPHQVRILPEKVKLSEIAADADLGAAGSSFTIALADRNLSPMPLRLHRGEHAFVLGPARSGRTNALAAIAEICGDRCVVVGNESANSELSVCNAKKVLRPEEVLEAISGKPHLVLVDDCFSVDDQGGVLENLVNSPPPGTHIVASAKADQLRTAYGHWATNIRLSKLGILLRPDPMDGDLLGVSLPARLDLLRIPGRGVLVADGHAEVVQVAQAATDLEEQDA